MDEDDPQPWMATGTTVYRLVPTGRYRKGEAVMENEFTVQVSGRQGNRGETEYALAQKIADLLNAL